MAFAAAAAEVRCGCGAARLRGAACLQEGELFVEALELLLHAVDEVVLLLLLLLELADGVLLRRGGGEGGSEVEGQRRGGRWGREGAAGAHHCVGGALGDGNVALDALVVRLDLLQRELQLVHLRLQRSHLQWGVESGRRAREDKW